MPRTLTGPLASGLQQTAQVPRCVPTEDRFRLLSVVTSILSFGGIFEATFAFDFGERWTSLPGEAMLHVSLGAPLLHHSINRSCIATRPWMGRKVWHVRLRECWVEVYLSFLFFTIVFPFHCTYVVVARLSIAGVSHVICFLVGSWLLKSSTRQHVTTPALVD